MRGFIGVLVLVVTACWVGDDRVPSGGAPSIVSRSPDEGAVNVYVADPIRVVFSKAIAPGAAVTLTDEGGRTIEHQDDWSADRTTLTSIIAARPAAPTVVTILISGVADSDGQVMPDATWSWRLPMWQQPGDALNLDAAMGAGRQRMTIDSQHRLVVGWYEVDRIRVKRFSGSTWETLGDALGGAGAGAPAVAIDGDDRPVVAWSDGANGVQVARWNGTTWTMLPSPGAGTGVALAADAGGTIYVAMQAAGVTLSRITASDTWEGLGGPAGSIGATPTIALTIAATGPVVAWVVLTSTVTAEIRSARLTANGASAWESLANVNLMAASTAYLPDLTVDATGRAVIAWQEYDGGSFDVHVATLSSAGTWQLLGRTLDVDILDHCQWPAVAVGPDGTIFVAWSEFHGPVGRLWVARSQAGGDWEFVAGEAVNREPGSFPVTPRLAVLERWPVVAWQDWQGDDGMASKVWVRRYNGNEVRLPGLTSRPTTAGCTFDANTTVLLSQTGCFTTGPDPIPNPGLIPFDINSPLWSDGALKRRWMVLPDGQTAQLTDADGWTMPVGTIIIKEFALVFDERDARSRRPIETRFLVKRDAANNWEGFSFQWRDDFSDATLLPSAATTKNWTLTTWTGTSVVHTHTYPSRDECGTCHIKAANVVLGISSQQLSRFYDYGGVVDQELEVMDWVGLLSAPLSSLPTNPLSKPSDVAVSLETRARAYMAANCAHCHRPGGARPTRDIRWETPLAQTMLCADSVIVPGSPTASVLYQRMSARPGMPPLATLVTDAPAIDLVNRWISGMTSCP